MPDLPTLSLDAARALSGPDGLRDRRAAAAERFTAEPLPTAEEEVWRYSRVADIDLAAMVPALAPTDAAAALPDRVESILALARAEDPAATVVVVDGHVVRLDVDPGWEAKGLVVGRPAIDGTGLDALGAGGSAPDAFAVANDAFAPDPVVIDVPRVLDVTAPVVIVRWRTATPGTVAFPRIVIRVGEAAAVAVLDVDLSAPDATGLALPVVELVAARGARLGYLGVQDLGLDAWQITTQLGDAVQEATLSSTAAVFGGAYARLRTDCRLSGRGATGNLRAAYFGEGAQTLDFRTFQDHAAPDTRSDLLFKGAVGGVSRSVYTGLIRVRPDARGTDAFQTNRNIKLSEGAWAESVPNLKIENNDVHCSHASAVGPVDTEQVFYLESRGVPTPVAERLIVAGFFDDVLDTLPVAAAAGPLRTLINGKLDRREP